MNADRTQRFHALADPTRLGILERLLHGERCVCELTGALDAAQSRLSFHLRVLREAGLIRARKAGRWIYYSLVPGAFEALQQELAPFASASVSQQPLMNGCGRDV
jgi:ArsR family transcriptional regulator